MQRILEILHERLCESHGGIGCLVQMFHARQKSFVMGRPHGIFACLIIYPPQPQVLLTK